MKRKIALILLASLIMISFVPQCTAYSFESIENSTYQWEIDKDLDKNIDSSLLVENVSSVYPHSFTDVTGDMLFIDEMDVEHYYSSVNLVWYGVELIAEHSGERSIEWVMGIVRQAFTIEINSTTTAYYDEATGILLSVRVYDGNEYTSLIILTETTLFITPKGLLPFIYIGVSCIIALLLIYITILIRKKRVFTQEACFEDDECWEV